MAEEQEIQRWTAKRRTALVVSMLKGATSAKEVARKQGLTLAEVESWVGRGLSGMENRYRVLQLKRWFVHQRSRTSRPRMRARRSPAGRSNQRWATDVTHIRCGADGWGHLTAVIDCHDRESIGYEFELRGRAKEAERAPEKVCIPRSGTLCPTGATPVARYTPEQNGMIERFFRSLKEGCVQRHNFVSFAHAHRQVGRWIEWYNTGRPHQSLGYKSPGHSRQGQLVSVT